MQNYKGLESERRFLYDIRLFFLVWLSAMIPANVQKDDTQSAVLKSHKLDVKQPYLSKTFIFTYQNLSSDL